MSRPSGFLIIAFVLPLIWGTATCAKDSPQSYTDTDSPVAVRAYADKDVIAIGDKIKYMIEVKAEKGMEIQPPVIDEKLTGFAVRDFGSQTNGLFGKKTTTFWFLLDTYETGKHIIPGRVIEYREKGSEAWQEAPANEVEIEVKSMLGDVTEQADIKDIKDPVGFPDMTSLYILLGTAGALAIAAATFFLLRRTKKSRVVISLSRPAHEIAYEALIELERRNYPKSGRIKDYYTALSDIVRKYLENRFLLRAPEMTTEEFLHSIRDSRDLNAEQKGLLMEFLSQCDMVKFARYNPETAEMEKSHASARRLIDQTKAVSSDKLENTEVRKLTTGNRTS